MTSLWRFLSERLLGADLNDGMYSVIRPAAYLGGDNS